MQPPVVGRAGAGQQQKLAAEAEAEAAGRKPQGEGNSAATGDTGGAAADRRPTKELLGGAESKRRSYCLLEPLEATDEAAEPLFAVEPLSRSHKERATKGEGQGNYYDLYYYYYYTQDHHKNNTRTTNSHGR